MATLQKAIKVGSSVAAVLPKPLLKGAGIVAGSAISVEAVQGGVLIRSVRQTSGRTTVMSTDQRVAKTALNLIKRYQNALDRLAEEPHDDGMWETVADFRSINARGVPAGDVLEALHRLHEPNRKVSRRS